MSMLRKYFDEAERRYNYRIKTIHPLDETGLDAVEKAIVKYNPFDISQISKTILHRNPLDFPNVKAAEVYSVDISLGLPVSPSVLRKEIADNMGIRENDIMVRGENDPTEIENQRINADADIATEAKGDEPATLLDTALDYPEVEAIEGDRLYGDAYNGKLLQTMMKIAAERKTNTVKSHNYDDVKSDVPADTGHSVETKDIEDVETSKHGNLDDNTKKYARVYKNSRVIKKDGVAVKRGS